MLISFCYDFIPSNPIQTKCQGAMLDSYAIMYSFHNSQFVRIYMTENYVI